MRTPLALALAVALTLPLAAVAQDAAPRDPAFAQAMVAAHNAVRAEVGAPPLAWSQQLADEAEDWARSLMARGAFEHSKTEEGENLALIQGARVGGPALTRGWIGERAKFSYGPLQCDSGFGAVGHYTQMVWSGTKAVGCGLVTQGSSQVLVCRYAPAGNICGERPY